MSNESSAWYNILNAVLRMPGVKVNRDEFLRRELSSYCTDDEMEKILSSRPINFVSKDVIDSVANSCINNHTAKATTLSFAAGIPGGLTMLGTIPADTVQYFFHVVVLAQKLAYLYAFPNLVDKDGNLTDSACDMLTIFVGVMLGASVANVAINQVAQGLGEQVLKRLPQKVLNAAYHPLIKQVAKWIGVSMTKETFAKGIGKIIPILGGVLSGGVTYFTFRPQAKRLQRKLQECMQLMSQGRTIESPKEEDYTEYSE